MTERFLAEENPNPVRGPHGSQVIDTQTTHPTAFPNGRRVCETGGPDHAAWATRIARALNIADAAGR